MGVNLLHITPTKWSGLFVLIVLLTGCNKSPQPVRHLGAESQPDSMLMAQLYFNQRMTDEADKQCLEYVKYDTLHTYAQDEFGFWYTLLYSFHFR